MFTRFIDYLTIKQLYDIGFSNLPNKKGLYLVKKPESMTILFSDSTTAIAEYKGKSMLYNKDVLLLKYEQSDKETLYIGKASGDSNMLKQRIRQFVNYGYGLVDNHRGGRATWQILNSESLLLGIMKCDEASKTENDLLQLYYQRYGVLPLANWKIG